jgi:hypothetical protein
MEVQPMNALVLCVALSCGADPVREDYATVKTVDAKTRTVTLDNKVSLTLPEKANIRKARGQVATFAEIKVGMPVRAVYRGKRVIIFHLDVKPPKRYKRPG